MIYDFTKTFKTYNANSYKKSDFASTRCPKCPAVGRFNLHGSYYRHAAYFTAFKLVCELVQIKRIKCVSCKSTHAVMPGDLIPYRLISLFLVMYILNLFYIQKKSVLSITAAWGFSFQFIYSVLFTFHAYMAAIYNHFRESSGGTVPPGLDAAGLVELIKKPYLEFQENYIKLNKRPCFMIRFFYKAGAPPAGILT